MVTYLVNIKNLISVQCLCESNSYIMAEFVYETKLVKNKTCHYFHQDSGFKYRRKDRKPSGVAYFICMKETIGCKATLKVKYEMENIDREPTITR